MKNAELSDFLIAQQAAKLAGLSIPASWRPDKVKVVKCLDDLDKLQTYSDDLCFGVAVKNISSGEDMYEAESGEWSYFSLAKELVKKRNYLPLARGGYYALIRERKEKSGRFVKVLYLIRQALADFAIETNREAARRAALQLLT